MTQRHKTVDVLVNNAGIASWEGQGPIEGMLRLPVFCEMRLSRATSRSGQLLQEQSRPSPQAGTSPYAGDMKEWQKMMKLDLELPMRLTRRLSPAMVRAMP